MADQRFDIVFHGDIVAGHTIADVKARLAQLFKTDAARIESLFSGGAVPLKRDLDQASAEKYRNVLLKAGAQVQMRRVAAETKHAAQTSKQQAPAAVSAPPNAASARAFSLAPAGSDLLNPEERRKTPERKIDFSGISLRPIGGDLLDASEKRPAVVANVEAGAFDLAEVGADLLEGFRSEALPLAEVDPEFDLAEPGADLLPSDYRAVGETVEINVSHLDVLPLDTR